MRGRGAQVEALRPELHCGGRPTRSPFLPARLGNAPVAGDIGCKRQRWWAMARITAEQLSELYDNCSCQLALFLRQWTPNAGREDIVQEAFVRLMRRRRAPDNPKAWLFRVARTLAVSHHRKTRRRGAAHCRLQADTGDWFDPTPGKRIDARVAQTALTRLPVEQREVVVLRVWGRLKLHEIADIVGAPLSTVHSRYQAALVALRQELEPCEPFLSPSSEPRHSSRPSPSCAQPLRR